MKVLKRHEHRGRPVLAGDEQRGVIFVDLDDRFAQFPARCRIADSFHVCTEI
jgi:hypothetical protein